MKAEKTCGSAVVALAANYLGVGVIAHRLPRLNFKWNHAAEESSPLVGRDRKMDRHHHGYQSTGTVARWGAEWKPNTGFDRRLL